MWWWFAAWGCDVAEISALRTDAFACADCSRERLTEIVDATPDCLEARLTLAAVHHQRGDAISALAVLEAGDHAEPRVMRALADARFRAGLPSEDLLRQAIEHWPTDAMLPQMLAETLPLSERSAVYEQALAQNPHNDDLVIAAMENLVTAGRNAEAVDVGEAFTARQYSDQVLDFLVELRGASLESTWSETDGEQVVIVYSARAARRRFEKKLHAMGYTTEVDKGGRTRFLSSEPMSPWVDVYADGRVQVQRSGAIQRPNPPANTMALKGRGPRQTGLRLGGVPNIQDPDPSRATQQAPEARLFLSDVVSARKLGPRRAEVMESMTPELIAWRMALEHDRSE